MSKNVYQKPPPLSNEAKTGRFLAFLSVPIEKPTARQRAEVLEFFDTPMNEADALKQVEANATKLEAALKSAKVSGLAG